MTEIMFLLPGIGAIIIGVIMLFFAQKKMFQGQALLAQAHERWQSSQKEIEHEKRESLLRRKEELYK